MKRTPFSVNNGRPHAQSLAAKRRAELTETVANAGKTVTAPVVIKQAPVVASTAPESPDALANGEFKLFEKGHGAKAEKKCDCKEGESCDKCKKDDKKEWVPPWKKDGVENAAEPASESDALANKLAAATKPMDALANAGTSEGASKGWETRRGGAAIPPHTEWSRFAGGTGAEEGKYGHDFRHPNGKTYSINPISSKYGHHQGYRLTVFPSKTHGHGTITADGEENSNFAGALHRSTRDAVKAAKIHADKHESANKLSNAGTSEGAREGWLTRRGGVRADEEFDHEDGSGRHVKLTIQGQNEGQKNIELNLPKEVHAAIAAGKWQPNAELERHSKGEDFHTIHGYESVAGLRAKYGKGSEPDKINGIIGGQIARAKAYYARARDFGEGTEAQNTLKAKAESIIKEIHDKHHPALAAAKLAHGSGPVVNRGYGALLNSFRGGLLKNYSFDTQAMLDEVMMYAENGEALPDDLREQYEEWLDEQD